jgi:PemK-like, MazF-like toxin of type II toxin-antitoxin system
VQFRLPRIRAVRPVVPSLRRVGYAPKADGRPDPGEVVWAWVPYEEDPAQGKDRPVLVIGEEDGQLLALGLTSRDHDVDAEQEHGAGREWMDIGTGAWDSQGRPSEVRLNRLLRLDPDGVRREGAALSKDMFEAVVEAARPYL